MACDLFYKIYSQRNARVRTHKRLTESFVHFGHYLHFVTPFWSLGRGGNGADSDRAEFIQDRGSNVTVILKSRHNSRVIRRDHLTLRTLKKTSSGTPKVNGSGSNSQKYSWGPSSYVQQRKKRGAGALRVIR